MIVLISLDVLVEKNLVDYYYIDLDDKGKKSVGGKPCDEFMQYSGLSRVADEFIEKLNTVNFYFKLQSKHMFFMSCLKFGLIADSYQMLDLKEENILSFAFLPDAVTEWYSSANKEERLKIKENIFKLL